MSFFFVEYVFVVAVVIVAVVVVVVIVCWKRVEGVFLKFHEFLGQEWGLEE